MLIPIIENYHSKKSPIEVFRSLYVRGASPFFLDSVECRSPNQNYSYLGADPFLEVTVKQGGVEVSGREKYACPLTGLFPLLRRLFRKYKAARNPGVDFFTGGAVGFFAYELAGLFEKTRFRKKPDPGVPLFWLGFYRDLIVYDHRRKIYKLVTHDEKGPRKEGDGFVCAEKRLRELTGYFAGGACGESKGSGRFLFRNFRPGISEKNFKAMVLRAKEYIAAGDIYQANLSQRFSFRYRGSPFKIYEILREINPSPFASFLRVGGFDILSSSPERLILKRGNRCETNPIAGTRPRFMAHRGTASLVRELLASEKERAEHIMLVDLERNDLGRVCDWPTVKVKEMMRIEKYSHVIHIVSKIVGRLSSKKDRFDLLRAMFPGGTITGCPKIRCMEIIDELEPVRRGIYTGSIGYLGFDGDMDLNLVIRTLVLKRNRGHFQVGAGIVHDSEPEREYEETLHKGEALIEALVRASL